MNNKIIIKLDNGKEIVAELYNYDGYHPEIAVYLQENDIVMQDICIVRPHEEGDTQNGDVDCLVWSDAYSEDYTHKFIISQYVEDEYDDN